MYLGCSEAQPGGQPPPSLMLAKLPFLPLQSLRSWFFASLARMFLILPDTDSSLENGISGLRCLPEGATKLQITAEHQNALVIKGDFIINCRAEFVVSSLKSS